MRAGVAPDTRQGILTMLTAPGEFPETAQEAPAVQGSFDFGTASLREAVPSLRMTELIADWPPSVRPLVRGCRTLGGRGDPREVVRVVRLPP